MNYTLLERMLKRRKDNLVSPQQDHLRDWDGGREDTKLSVAAQLNDLDQRVQLLELEIRNIARR